jgi:hypothetical protein
VALTCVVGVSLIPHVFPVQGFISQDFTLMKLLGKLGMQVRVLSERSECANSH